MRIRFWTSRIVGWVILCGLPCTPAGAADGREFKPADGRDTFNYPPDPQVRFERIKLDIEMPDPLSRSFDAVETITFNTLAEPLTEWRLDAVGLEITSVKDAAGRALTFRQDDEHVYFEFEPALPPATDAAITIQYACRNPLDGLHFILPDETDPDRPVSIHSQGESRFNRYWFVCHDFPNARSSTELRITLPQRYGVVSNGDLVEKSPASRGEVTWHYVLEQRHPAYLVSLAIGDYVKVADAWRHRPVEYWVFPYQEKDARPTFARTPEMIETYSQLLGVAYPYAKYAQACTSEFEWGGMENTSCTTMFQNIVPDERARLEGDQDDLICHELAHQWFGDMVTCRSWPHIWLNEGFATYMEYVWDEHAHGSDEYLYRAWNAIQDVAGNDEDDLRTGVVFFDYDDSEHIFGRGGSNCYSKGGAVLHMLRMQLGDEVFWRCINEYLTRYAWQSIETDDFRKVVEEVSGRSLARFFQQWLYRPGEPHVKVTYQWDPPQGQARLTFEQTQKISIERPAYALDIPVWFFASEQAGATAGPIRRTAHMDQRTAQLTVTLDSEPSQICVDPQAHVLAKFDLQLPSAMLVRQAGAAGPTVAARAQAIRLIADKDRDDVRQLLSDTVADNQLHHGLRTEAAGALGRMQTDAARDALLGLLNEDQSQWDARVRKAVVSALGQYKGPRVVSALLPLARHDALYGIEAAASRALGHQESSDEMLSLLLANCDKTSQNDQIRSAALDALVDLHREEAVEIAMRMARWGAVWETRPKGIGVLGRLAADNIQKDRIREFVTGLLHDRQQRAVSAAIAALGDIGADESLDDLQGVADSAAPPRLRKQARDTIEAVKRKLAGEKAPPAGQPTSAPAESRPTDPLDSSGD